VGLHAGSLFYTDAFGDGRGTLHGLISSPDQGDGLGREASIIGQVVAQHKPEVCVGVVTMHTSIGVTRIVDMLSSEQLPRIC
jgi:hypothetical protein